MKNPDGVRIFLKILLWMGKLLQNSEYTELIQNIGNTITNARENSYKAINKELIQSYWLIGKYIVEYEQAGNIKAEYGKQLIDQLASDLTTKYGKGFSRTNVVYIRLFYIKYPISQTVSDQLSWSHYIELLSISDDLERSFYENQSKIENWSVRDLKRQKSTGLFQRIALSKDKDEILKLAKEGHFIKDEKDFIKEPYVFEFLGFPENNLYSESDLEKKLINNLQLFLLELGKGFAFISRQYRITLNNRHFYVDLVFYHYILKCFVLIDLKINKLEHYDIGQMVMYLNYFAKERNIESDNEPIGIILTRDKDDVLVEYTTASISNKLAISNYQTYLPDKNKLRDKLIQLIDDKENKSH